MTDEGEHPVANEPPLGIVTPEAVVLEFDTGGVGSRVIAEVLDVLVMGFVAFGLVFAAAAVASAGGAAGTAALVFVILFLFLDFVGYPIAMETLWNGRTLGKAAMGLRVVTHEGGPIRFRHAAIRGIFGIVEIYLFSGAIATTSMILSKRDQRLGDHVAGTIVLRERHAASQAVAVSFPPLPGYETYIASLDVAGLSHEQYGIIRSFLMRVLELTPPARAALAVRLANPTALLLRHQPPPTLQPETFLVCVAAAYQHRQGGPNAAWSVSQWPGLPPPPSSAPPPPLPPPTSAGPVSSF